MAAWYDRNPNGQSVLPQQRRFGGGIVGGGDTPTKTQWKLNAGYGYICGKYENGQIFIEGPEEAKFFGINKDGRIIAFMSTETVSLEQLNNMLAPYFEEITTVQILVVTGLAIGDDVPNWDNYETLE